MMEGVVVTDELEEKERGREELVHEPRLAKEQKEKHTRLLHLATLIRESVTLFCG